MTPDELAKSGSEHGHQRALFAWAAMAEVYGFAVAWDDRAYLTANGRADAIAEADAKFNTNPVAELRWMHAIPNGGLRDKATAGKLKAEGVKRGIPDVFLPLPMFGPKANIPCRVISAAYCGLYVEMKRAETLKAGVRKALIINRIAGTTSEDQDEFIGYARRTGYAVTVCFDWREAAKQIQEYIETVRLNA